MTEWNKDLEKKILRKSRFILTFRIIRILLLTLILLSIYISAVNILVIHSNVIEKTKYFSTLALEWTVPNVKSDFSSVDVTNVEISMFGTINFSYNLIKEVGTKEKVIGEAQVKKSLFNIKSEIKYSYPGLEESNSFRFHYPENPLSHEKIETIKSPEVWETLNILPEGTVGELAFSTTSFMEPEQLIEKLQKYDLHILWMPLYTGEFINFNPNSWSGDGYSDLIVSNIGLTGGMNHEEEFLGLTKFSYLNKDSIEESKKLMLKNMKELLDESDSYVENFLGISYLEERYNYLKNEGFTVYGAVVTGPVKELLKLKDEQFIHDVQLGEVELWNWDTDE